MAAPRVIDGDGHIFEDMPAIAKHIPDYYLANWRFNAEAMFPPLDHLHNFQDRLLPGAFAGGKHVGPEEWINFMDAIGLESAVLYPTRGLGVGKMVDYDWAIAVCRAYNNWLSETYVRRDPRFKGMALLPMQEPVAAAEELERAVTELGMSGTMLASTGLPSPLGAKTYWPVYKVADRLGCAVAVHGGAHEGFGMDHFNVYAPVHALGHPFGQMVSFGNMIFNGVCDNFPNVKFGFLEAGVAWLLMCLERFDRSYETHKHYDLSGQLIRLRDGESVSKYIKRNIREGRIFVGCEGEEPELAYAISEVGAEAFVFSTDYPHEVTIEMCRHEIEELMETEDISDDAKDAVLYRNAQRFYNLAPVAVSA
jgi:uncharacterized protein